MREPRGHQRFHTLVAVLILGSAVSTAHADPLTIPGYAVTDLGSGTPTFSTDANGNGVLNAPNGQIYAFPQTPNTVLTPGQGIMANFPQLEKPPTNYSEDHGDPAYDYSRVTAALINSNGIVAATNVAGISGHEYTESAYVLQKNPDGTWGQPTLAYASTTLYEGFSGGFTIVGLSKTNEILIQNNSPSLLNLALVYNANTHTLTDLGSLLLSARPTYYGFNSLAIDDEGRILLRAQITWNGSSPNAFTTLLLTPDGLSPAPLAVPAPEPGTLAVMLLAIAGFAAHRARDRRRPS